jgi:hypothetical protein
MTVRPRSGLSGAAGLVLAAALLAGCSAQDAPAMGAGGSAAGSSDSPSVEPDATATQAATSEPSLEAETTDGDGASEPPEDLEVLGSVTVDNQEYQLHEVRRCIPLEAEGVERELELQARGFVSAGEGYDGEDWVQLDVAKQTIAGAPYDDVSWAGPEGVFGSTVQPSEVVFSGTMATGRGTLVDALTQEATVTVSFMVDVPEEEIDCRP